MTQWIITILILAAALIFAGKRILWYFIRRQDNKKNDCGSFGGDCSKCKQGR